MANLCWNTLTIKGEQASLDKLRDHVKGRDLVIDFDTVLPAPKDEDGEVDEYWAIDHWGCVPPDEEDMSLSEQSGELVYKFVTIKGDPMAAVRELSRLFPSLTIQHEFDHEYEVKGGFVYQAGEPIEALPFVEF
jgi:hypothetical protein